MTKIELDALAAAWSKSLKRARAQQAIIDDKMCSYLNGTGQLPTLVELAKVEQLWEIHDKARHANNRFIAQQINSKHSPTLDLSKDQDRRLKPRPDIDLT